MVLGVIIMVSATMFYSMFMGSIECDQFCIFWSSWFEVYTINLGNYQPNGIFGVDPYNYNFHMQLSATQVIPLSMDLLLLIHYIP